jgi:hypothetical protein
MIPRYIYEKLDHVRLGFIYTDRNNVDSSSGRERLLLALITSEFLPPYIYFYTSILYNIM